MKVKVTKKGVYDDKGKRVEVGKVLTIKGDEIPSNLVNKCVAVETAPAKKAAPKKEPVINPAKPAATAGGSKGGNT